MKTRVYTYARFSSDQQEAGSSLDRQKELISKWLQARPELRDVENMEDKGVSARDGQNIASGVLAGFLDRLDKDLIPSGSYFLVEALDRLSRADPLDSLPLLCRIIKSGIRLVTVKDGREYSKGDTFSLMAGTLGLSQANFENEERIRRVRFEIAQKMEARAKHKQPYSRVVPSWIQIDGAVKVKGKNDFTNAKPRLIEPVAKVIRKMFDWCIQGHGSPAILKKLKAKYPPITKSWHLSYITAILRNTSTYGDYQLKRPGPKRGKKHTYLKDLGNVIEGLFPAVISRDTFLAAAAARQGRNRKGGRKPADPKRGMFTGILYDAIDECRLQVTTRKAGRKALVSAKANRCDGGRWCTFPEEVFRNCILEKLREIKVSEIVGDSTTDEVAVLTGELSLAKAALKSAEAGYEEAGTEDSIMKYWRDRINKCITEIGRISHDLKAAEIAACTPVSKAWVDLKSVDPLKLQKALRSTIESIYCVFTGDQKGRRAVVQVFFKGSSQRRAYVIDYRPAKAGFVEREEYVHCESWVYEHGAIDLRKREDAELILTKIPIPASLAGPQKRLIATADNSPKSSG